LDASVAKGFAFFERIRPGNGGVASSARAILTVRSEIGSTNAGARERHANRLLKFRFADQFVKKLKRKNAKPWCRVLPELVVSGWCVWERLVWVWRGW
jgi:hypothetical protein